MSSIYEINQAIMDCLDPETGEILDMEALEALQMDRVQKAENVACWRKNLMAMIASIKAEEDALKKREKLCSAGWMALTAIWQRTFPAKRLKLRGRSLTGARVRAWRLWTSRRLLTT